MEKLIRFRFQLLAVSDTHSRNAVSDNDDDDNDDEYIFVTIFLKMSKAATAAAAVEPVSQPECGVYMLLKIENNVSPVCSTSGKPTKHTNNSHVCGNGIHAFGYTAHASADM